MSQGFITGIVQDRQGFMWIASRDGLCRYDGRTFRTFKPTSTGKPSLSFPGLVRLILDHRGMIWIISERGDLDRFDPRTETFTNVSQLPAFKQAFPHSGPGNVWLDRQDRLWIIFNAWGTGMYDTRTGRCQLYRPQQGQPDTLEDPGIGIAEDNLGRCWVATYQGLMYFDAARQRLIAPTFPVPHDGLNGLYRTQDGQFLISSSQQLIRLNPLTGQTQAYSLPPKRIVWDQTHFTTDNKGVIYFQREGLLYQYTHKEGPRLLRSQSSGSSIEQGRSLWVDRSDVLWIGTNGGGIRTYDLRGNPIQTAPYQVSFHVDLLRRWLGVKPNLPTSYVTNGSSYNFRYTIDQQHRLWFNAATQPFQRLDLVSGHLTTIPSPAPPKGPTPYPMATDPAGQIWVVYDSLAWHYQAEMSKWIPFDHTIRISGSDPPLQLVVDQQALWLATSRGGLLRIDRRTGVHRQFTHVASNPASINSNSLYCMSADPIDPNRLWIGTFGAGLCAFDKRTGQCRRFTEADGLPNNVIYSAIPDQQGYLWMGTNKGLVRMHRKTFQMRTYTHEDGLLADEFNRFHFLHLPRLGIAKEQIYMGGVEGITAFSPRQIQDDRFSPSVEITQIQINNQPLSLSPPDTVAVPFLPVQVLQELELPYDQNFLTVRFAIAQYNKPEKNRFRYQLEGLTNQWVETTQPEAIYTNLSPGHYVLKLNASNTSGQWSPHVRTLSVSIHPPYWATWWAYVVYGLLVFGIAYVVLRSYINRLRLQQKLTLQQQSLAFQERETQQLRVVDEMKTRFFSNVTHEFRTPLTLILTPVQQLKQKYADTDDQRRLGVVERNAYQLLELINQLLDLSKLEAKAMTVQKSVGNLSEFIEETVRSFREEADRGHIELGYQPQLTGDFLFDRAKLERIIYNLVSNALKFSRAGDRVVVTVQQANDGFVQIMVTDTGIGISLEQVPFIFDRFYQADDSPTRSQEGTGIGLALVKELVDVQAGTVSVNSQPGAGTTFTVRLPYQPAFDGQPVPKALDTNQARQPIHKSQPTTESPLILVVEDNDDLAEFISQSLPAWYRVVRASDGAQGLDIAIERMPDLVLSDVLMPGMDGYTLCEKLKADPYTSHIPVVLLTAKNTLDSRVKGLGLGADDYITKPFHLAELQLRIQNLLDNRQRLRDWVRQSLADPDRVASTDELAQSDPFLLRFYTILNNHLDDSEFGINQLSREIGMSRASLYRKLEAISSLSANELIQNYRLKRATEYLRDGQTITATAYLVGFSSPSYFSSCFRKLYKLTPSEFIAQEQQAN
ncbi:hybrid sensor histidine kinase/response regulator transcription factor [Spirosoma endophyticum]|uniref:hybrid sensor histidine kinase/response regulator transcription factor n=1 Tax=Spirosoma endophyticum TaxID=662367 RepID=UPI0015A5FCE3|nr:hybrid sensor histidine kinase/response regulator transcription factor [Spirosoma endophyticum]